MFLVVVENLTVALDGLPSVAFVTLLNAMLNVSVDSRALSSATDTLKFFVVSPTPKEIAPETPV